MAKYIRYMADEPQYGEIIDNRVHPLIGEFGQFTRTGAPPIPLESVTILAPVSPSKVVAVGPNYHAHLGGNAPPPRPYLWLKPSSALLDPEGEIELPQSAPMVCHESELAIVIGKTARNVSPEQAAGHIFGYTCINDVSAGNLADMATHMQSQYFVDGKINDTFAPLGPVIVTDIDPHDLRIQCRINGEVRQDHRTSDQIWPPAELVSIISRAMTLFPGDVIGSGSPPRVGPIEPGDIVEVEVEGIGILRNRAVASPT